MNKPIEIVVGGGGVSPAAGTSQYNNPLLAGLDIYVEKIGYGTYDSVLWSRLSTGGFQLLGGNTFQAGEQFRVHFTGLSYGTGQTTYTNGFNYSQVIAALFGRVGWMQPSISGSPVLSSVNTTSRGGRYYQDFHALVTIQNIKSVMEEVAATDSSLNAYLEALQRGIILRCLNGVFNEPEYLSQQLLFNANWKRNNQPVENSGLFVHALIRVPPAPDIAVQVDSIALYFDSAVTFNLYVFNDAIKAPLAVIEVTTVANSQTVINLSDIVLNHIGGSNLGGTFYIGYFQDDIGNAKAIWEQGCPQFKAPYYWSFGEADKLAGEYDFDRENVRMNNVNYGINLHVSTFRDHTWQIVHKAALFDNVIGLQMAAQVLEHVIFSKRSNSDERQLKDVANTVAATTDLTGVTPISDGPPNTMGMRKQITQELVRLKQSFFRKPKAQTISAC